MTDLDNTNGTGGLVTGALFPNLKNLHFPAKSSMQIAPERKAKTVKRFRYPVTAAYCFTD